MNDHRRIFQCLSACSVAESALYYKTVISSHYGFLAKTPVIIKIQEDIDNESDSRLCRKRW